MSAGLACYSSEIDERIEPVDDFGIQICETRGGKDKREYPFEPTLVQIGTTRGEVSVICENAFMDRKSVVTCSTNSLPCPNGKVLGEGEAAQDGLKFISELLNERISDELGAENACTVQVDDSGMALTINRNIQFTKGDQAIITQLLPEGWALEPSSDFQLIVAPKSQTPATKWPKKRRPREDGGRAKAITNKALRAVAADPDLDEDGYEDDLYA